MKIRRRKAMRLSSWVAVACVWVGAASGAAADGEAAKGWLGFGFTYPRHAEADSDAGLVVQAVLPNSPAEKAGLRRGDHVLLLDGAPIVRHSESSVLDFVLAVRPGQEVEVGIRRDGERRTLRLIAQELPPQYLEGWLRMAAARDRLRRAEEAGRGS